MKKSKILIALFAVMAAAPMAGAEGISPDFDGRTTKGMNLNYADGGNGLLMFAQLLNQALPSPEAAGIPVRVFTPEDNSSMDKAIGSAIAYARKKEKTELAAGLECLRNSGTPEQKALFVYDAGNAAYVFPPSCVASGKSSTANKGLLNDGLQWLCESYNDVVEYLSCTKGPDGEEVCDVKLRTILRTSCHWG